MRARSYVFWAIAVVFVVSRWVPFGDVALYPLTLFTTWVHEMGHGLTALALGGEFTKLMIFKSAGGYALAGAAAGWRDAAVALGGLLAPPIVGAILIATVHGPKRARLALTILAAGLVLSCAIWVRSTTGLVTMPLCAVVFAWVAWRGFKESPEWRVIITQVLGVVLALDTVTRMVDYVFMKHVVVDGKASTSDIQNVADNVGGPYWAWGAIVTMVALVMLGVSLWWALHRPAAKSPALLATRRQ